MKKGLKSLICCLLVVAIGVGIGAFLLLRPETPQSRWPYEETALAMGKLERKETLDYYPYRLKTWYLSKAQLAATGKWLAAQKLEEQGTLYTGNIPGTPFEERTGQWEIVSIDTNTAGEKDAVSKTLELMKQAEEGKAPVYLAVFTDLAKKNKEQLALKDARICYQVTQAQYEAFAQMQYEFCAENSANGIHDMMQWEKEPVAYATTDQFDLLSDEALKQVMSFLEPLKGQLVNGHLLTDEEGIPTTGGYPELLLYYKNDIIRIVVRMGYYGNRIHVTNCAGYGDTVTYDISEETAQAYVDIIEGIRVARTSETADS